MASTRDIRRRIKSIKNTGKITKAMEMISAVKMRKAVAQVLAIRPFANLAWHILEKVSENKVKKHDFFEIREEKKVLIVVVSSNRGLCGSFNAQIAKKVREEILQIQKRSAEVDFLVIGKKGENIVRRMGGNIIASFTDTSSVIKVETAMPISKILIDDFLIKKYDKIFLLYTDYVSAINQKTKVRQILPISKIDLMQEISEMEPLGAKQSEKNKNEIGYLIEPNADEVLRIVLPRLIEMQVYHALLESRASEESARMIAMKNATESSKELAGDLTFTYNQIRQSKITQEIAEISAGRLALEG